MPKRILLTAAACLAIPAGVHAGGDADAALTFLRRALQDIEKLPSVLSALKSTQDPDALPIFIALSKHEDPKLRSLSPVPLRDIADEKRAVELLTPLAFDPATGVRGEALILLDQLDAVTEAQLVSAMQADNDRLRCIAAQSLVRIGSGAKARPVLQELAGSKDLPTAARARMALLKLGDAGQLTPLREIMTPAPRRAALLMLLIEKAQALEVEAAAALVENLANDPILPQPLRVMAYRAVLEIAPDGPARLVKAIVKGGGSLPLHLVNLLARHEDGKAYLRSLSGRGDMVGALARLEIARERGGDALRRAAEAAIETGQPIAIGYVLDRARKDFTADAELGGSYVPGVMAYVAAQKDELSLTPAHAKLVESAVGLAVDAGTDADRKRIRAYVGAPYSRFVRAAAGGLLRSRTDKVCDVATALLDSPYEELATYGAFACGRHGRPEAAPLLRKIVSGQDDFRTSLRTVASWYLLEIEGVTAGAAETLAKLLP